MTWERDELVARLAANKVTVIAGTGVTVATTRKHPAADWEGLFKRLKAAKRFQEPRSDDQRVALDLVDIALKDYAGVDAYLAAASALRKGWGNDVLSWLNEQYEEVSKVGEIDPSVIEAIGRLGCPIATTNYDRLIERVLQWSHAVLRKADLAMSFLANPEKKTVLHLHGYYDEPSSLVLDEESYRAIVKDESAQSVLQKVDRSYLFIGCGDTFKDPNFTVLRQTFQRFPFDDAVMHFRLVRDAEEVEEDPKIKLVRYGDDFDKLAPFLEALAAETRPSNVIVSGPDPVRTAPRCDDVVVSFTSDAVDVTYTGAGQPVEVKGSLRPDWARRTTVTELDAELHWGEGTHANRLERAKLLGGHLMMRHGQELAKALLDVTSGPSGFHRCRMVLEFVANSPAEELPWEYLYSHGDDGEPDEAFLGRALGFSIIRRQRYKQQVSVPPRQARALHVMLVACDPGDALKLRLLKDRLRALEESGTLKLYELGEGVLSSPANVAMSFATHSSDLARIGEQLDVVHVVGEVADRTKVLLDANSSLTGGDLAAKLIAPDKSRPRLLLLHLQDAPTSMVGSAKSLIKVASSASARAIPNVMAVPYRPGDETNVGYVAALYRHLADGERVDAAIRMAADTFERESIIAGQPGECCVFPVLYCGEPNAFARARGPEPASGTRAATGLGVGRAAVDVPRSSRSEVRDGKAAERREGGAQAGTGFR